MARPAAITFGTEPRVKPEQPHPDTAADPSLPVQRQLDAYNARDLERFLAEYADDVQVFRMPATEPVLSGKRALGDHYARNRFNRPALHARLVNRIISGDIVVDHEEITGLSDASLAAVAVYRVVGGRIQAVWFF